MNELTSYLTQRTGHVERVAEYHAAKAGHSLLLALVIHVVSGWALPLCAVIAASGYLVAGKALQAGRSEWRDVTADTLIGGGAVALTLGWRELAVWALLYWLVVLRWRWAAP